MSNIQRFDNIKQIVQMVEPQFNELAAIHGAVNYKKEAAFALQILKENSYTADVAYGNPDSLKHAIINVAAIGLSLDPSKKLAYLVPRKKAICLDISYRGYVQLAVDVGAVKWVAAEIVRKNDKYSFFGMGREPIHEFEPFDENRGEIVGAYCIAKTHDGEFLVTNMPIKEIFSIRDRSESYKAGGNSPWKSDESEMIKKTVIRRASKSWPMTNTRAKERFEQAIDVSNIADPLDFSSPALAEPKAVNSEIEKIRESLKFLSREESQFIAHQEKITRRKLEKIEDMTEQELQKANVMLNQFVDAKKAKDAKEVTSEIPS